MFRAFVSNLSTPLRVMYFDTGCKRHREERSLTRDRYAADAYPAEHIQASTSAAYRPRVELRSSRCRLYRVKYEWFKGA